MREQIPSADWRVVDHYDSALMTEPYIRRARAEFPPSAGTLAVRFDGWTLADQSADVIFALLAIHELRSEAERTAWFMEAARVLNGNGRVILVEHVRDPANFLAFGPGFLHFHSVASWRRCWTRAGLAKVDQFRITPFVRVFVLTKNLAGIFPV